MPDRRSAEQRLAALATELERARTPDVVHAVSHELRPETARGGVSRAPTTGRRSVRPGLVIALALLAVVTATAFAASPVLRDDLLELIGLRGVKIERVPELPPAPPALGDQAGERISLAEAAQRASFELRRIGRAPFRRPDRVEARELDGTTVVSFTFAPRLGLPRSPHTKAGLLVTQLRARVDEPVFRKLVAGGDVHPVRVRGSRGYWLGGGDHVLTYRLEGRTAQSRLSGNVLVWQDGAVTLRIEAQVPKRRALRIARSVE